MLKTPQKIFQATVFSAELIARGVKKITFVIDGGFDFRPSQYVWVEIPNGKNSDKKGTRRAFSLINLPNAEGKIEIVGRISESGYKQNLFALKAGDTIIIHGPFGSSFIIDKEKLPKNLVFIAGGVGIAVFLSVFKYIQESKLPIKCFLVYLNNDLESTPFIEELKEMKTSYQLFDYNISYEKFSWNDIKKVDNDFSVETKWWISGSQGLVDHAYNILETAGISKGDMGFENYYPSVRNNLTIEKIAVQLADDNIFSKAIQNSTNHTVITDYNGVVLFANRAACQITGYNLEEILGNTPRLWGGMMNDEFYVNFWVKKRSGIPLEGEIINRRKNGDIYIAIAHISPIFDSDKNVIGYIGTEEDITELKESEEKVKSSEARFQFAFEGNRDGLWDRNLITDITFFSSRVLDFIGDTQENLGSSMSKWRSCIEKDDIKTIDTAWGAHLRGESKYYETSYRIHCKDGSEKWILDRGMVTERDKDGNALRAVGTFTDITESKAKEKELELMNSAMVDREIVMINLKNKIKELESHL